MLSLDEYAIPSDHHDAVLCCNASLDKTKNTEYGIPWEDILKVNIPIGSIRGEGVEEDPIGEYPREEYATVGCPRGDYPMGGHPSGTMEGVPEGSIQEEIITGNQPDVTNPE